MNSSLGETSDNSDCGEQGKHTRLSKMDAVWGRSISASNQQLRTSGNGYSVGSVNLSFNRATKN